jgi:hypothetical protein
MVGGAFTGVWWEGLHCAASNDAIGGGVDVVVIDVGFGMMAAGSSAPGHAGV